MLFASRALVRATVTNGKSSLSPPNAARVVSEHKPTGKNSPAHYLPISPTLPLPAPAPVSLRDDTFEPANPAAYHLCALAGPGRLRVLAVEAARHKVVAFDDVTYPADTGLLAALAEHPLLGQPGWGRVRLALAGPAPVLLPTPLFRAGDEAALLTPHQALSADDEALTYSLPLPTPATEVLSLFAADRRLAPWLRATHGAEARLLPQASGLLAGLLHQRGPAAAPRQLYLSLADQQLTAVVLGPQLEFCNVFRVSTAEDVLYYAILVMQELDLNPDQDPVTIWGELTGDSATFQLLSTYVRQLRFGARPFGLEYFYYLNEIAEHRHFDLFSLAFC